MATTKSTNPEDRSNRQQGIVMPTKRRSKESKGQALQAMVKGVRVRAKKALGAKLPPYPHFPSPSRVAMIFCHEPSGYKYPPHGGMYHSLSIGLRS